MRMEKNKNIIIICIIISFCFLLICSNNSFLYSFNDNQDINWYITMGRGLLEGRIPYRDLFEQKGPIVYFLFSFLCLFENPFISAFFVEIICLSIVLFYAYKIMRKYTDNIIALFGIVFISFLIVTSPYFVVGGGSVEEYCLPILMYMMTCFIEYMNENKKFNIKRSIIWGLLIGVIFFSKFTLVFLPLVMLGIIFILYIRRDQSSIQVLKNVSYIGLGFLSVTFFVCLFFIINKSFYDFIYVYFYINIFLYKTSTSIMYNLLNIVILGIVPFSIMILGIVEYMNIYSKHKVKYLYFLLFLLYLLFFLISGNFLYYYLPLAVFFPFGVLFIVNRIFKKMPHLICKITCGSCSVILLFLCLLLGNGTKELTWQKEDYIQFQVAKDIREINDDNPTLFCYKMWDYGFYNVLGVTPKFKYYANNLIAEKDFPTMYEEFKKYISNGETEFVLMEKFVYEEEKEFVEENYEYYKTYSYVHFKDNSRSFQMNVVLLVKKTK